MPPKQKTRVGVRLKEAIGGSKSINRSADLDALAERFNVLRQKLKNVIASLQAHHKSMQQLAKTRMDVANNIAMLTEKTPIHDSGGLLPSPENSGVVSYRSVHMDFSRRSEAYAEKYNQFIVDYAIEWDKVINTRVSAGIKEAETLRRDLDHYQGKVESLRQSTNKTLAAGKQVDAKTAERLSRNEDKLIKAKEFYNRFATDMCILIEEVTERAWKDLHPMLIKLSQFDSTMANDEAKALSQLNQVVSELKLVADKHGLTPQARLKDLAERKPSEISTAKSGGGLALESGDGFSGRIMGAGGGVTSSIYGDTPSMPPGSVSPQGIGGLPIPVSDTNGGHSNHLSRASSQSSFGSGANSNPGYSNYNLTTNDMMAISAAAAPPPSMEQVQDATSNMHLGGGGIDFNRDRTASGNSLPPLGPGYRRSSSIVSTGSNDAGSVSGSLGPPAPAPAAPPPPPPTTTTGLSMYGGLSGSSGSLPPTPTAPDAAAFGTGAYASPPAGAPPHPWSGGGSATSGGSPYGAAPAPAPFGAPTPPPPGRRSSNPFDDDDLPEF